jgi:hypothetical protein
MPTDDAVLVHIISASAPNSITEVIEIMTSLDAAMEGDDGLKWFNLLYLRVTEAIQTTSPLGGWEDPAWLERLDIRFANLYFQAIVDWHRDRTRASRAWRALFQKRYAPRIFRVQFALAGMNAHINHDLCMALVQAGEDLGIAPEEDTPQHCDFLKVNALLEEVQEQVKADLSTGIPGQIDQDLGQIDDIVTMWSVGRARDTAWYNGTLLWFLRSTPFARRLFLSNLDGIVGLAGRGLLAPVVL